MPFRLLLRGMIIGFSIAAPVGSIGILCIRRTLARGRRSGLLSGLGAATADAVYGAIAAFGLTALSQALIRQQIWLRPIGGAFLIFLGLRVFVRQTGSESEPSRRLSSAGAFVSTFALTITNPVTILAFAAVFAGLGLGSASPSYLSASMVVLGVFPWVGSMVAPLKQRGGPVSKQAH